MSNYNSLKATIDANIKQNGNQEITGQILNSVLNQMVTTLGAGYQFAGVATIATNPGTPDAKVFYIANGKGTYEKFGGINVTEDDVVVLYWDSSWHKVSTGIASQSKLSELVSDIAGEVVTELTFDVVGYYVDLSIRGELTEHPSARCTDFIEIDRSKKYLFTSKVLYNLAAIAYYDADKNFISCYPSTYQTTATDYANENINDILPIPANAIYVRFSHWGGTPASVKMVGVAPIEKSLIDIIADIEENKSQTELNSNAISNVADDVDSIKGTETKSIPCDLAGYYDVSNRGRYLPYASARSSELIEIDRSLTYRLTAKALWDIGVLFYWDENRNFISSYPSSYAGSAIQVEDQDINDILPIPQDAVYVSFGTYGTSISVTYQGVATNFLTLTELTQKVNNPGVLANKKGYFIGDSVMIGQDNQPSVKSITWYLTEKYKMNCVNKARGGAILTSSTSHYAPIYPMLTSIPSDADYIIMQGGLNGVSKDDASYPWGTITEGFSAQLDTISQLGCLEAMCKYVVTNFPGKKYGFIINYKIGSYSYWEEKSELIKQVLDKWGIPYLDWRHSGVNLASPEIAAVYGVDADAIYPAFSTSQSYALDARVRYDGKTYKANQAISPGAFNASQWDLVSTSRYDTWHCNAEAYKQLADKTAEWMMSL